MGSGQMGYKRNGITVEMEYSSQQVKYIPLLLLDASSYVLEKIKRFFSRQQLINSQKKNCTMDKGKAEISSYRGLIECSCMDSGRVGMLL